MAVGSGDPINKHTGNGVTRTFGYGFTLLNADDLTVLVDGVEVTSYTIAGIGDANGGSITFTTAPANDAAVVLLLVIAPERLTEYATNGDLLADTVNADFDRLWQAVGLASFVASRRTLRVPFDETLPDLPGATGRKSTVLGFDANGATSLQPLTNALNSLGVDLYDDGAWGGSISADDGLWG